MFSFIKCAQPGCTDFVCDDELMCSLHTPDKEGVKARARAAMLSASPMGDLSLGHAEFSGENFSRGKWVTCYLPWNTFRNCSFSGTQLIACYFNFSLFVACDFTGLDARYCVFAGCRFIDCDFSDSLLLHSNFMGIEAHSTDFSHSDLNYSTFLSSSLESVKFEDCSMKNTDMGFTRRQDVSFRYSNYDEAKV
ncbi:pentapeptide repeat protein [Parasphaerochaeta coccoides DSM 17374]|uniref:Pentapeptide repeat protein n=2 Tax=Parasphaerochaeta TaxID=3062336 RepID=F4GIH3_PARC1|nr:pentapeptide repeat protein [Parasphaerochaeta coccoides DSM 17374]